MHYTIACSIVSTTTCLVYYNTRSYASVTTTQELVPDMSYSTTNAPTRYVGGSPGDGALCDRRLAVAGRQFEEIRRDEKKMECVALSSRGAWRQQSSAA